MVSTARIVGEFQIGDAVPEWILVVNPDNGSTAHISATFQVDCVVVEYAGAFHVVTAEPSFCPAIQVIRDGGTDDDEFTIAAADTEVRIPNGTVLVLQPLGR